jgi:hypothetical protein
LAGYAKCRTLKGIPPIVAGLLKQMNQLLKKEKLRIRIDTKLLARVKKVRGLTLSDKVRRTLIASLNSKPIDNNDYADVLESIFEFRQVLSPVGSNLNQLTRLLNSEPHLFQEVQNIDMLDELKPLLKESIKMLKFIEQELRIR